MLSDEWGMQYNDMIINKYSSPILTLLQIRPPPTLPQKQETSSSIVCIIFYLKPLQNLWSWERRSYKPSSLVPNVRGRNKVERACCFAFSARIGKPFSPTALTALAWKRELSTSWCIICVLLHTAINSYCPIVLSYYRISESTFPILYVYYEFSQRKADDLKETSFVSFSIRRVEL